MDSGYLILKRGQSNDSLFFARDESERDAKVDVQTDYRISPIFAVDPDAAQAPELAATAHVGFFAFERAFTEIARAKENSDKSLRGHCWFSYGLASFIVFTSDSDQLLKIRDNAIGTVRSFEHWAIRDHSIDVRAVELSPPVEVNVEEFTLIGMRSTDDFDLRHLVDEIRNGVNALTEHSVQHAPHYLDVIKNLIFAINGRVAHIRTLKAELDEMRPTVATQTIEVATLETVERLQKRINAATDHLVQINSILAYALSQTFGGAAPLLENRCFVHSHSLLGIGTAIASLHAFTRKVDDVFTDIPVHSAVRDCFRIAKPLNVFRSLADVDLSEWKGQKQQTDLLIERAKSEEQTARPHLLFFSGRLGFHEAAYSLSAALQALPAADTARWSLMTLSHELMHAHVRQLFESILAPDIEVESGNAAFVETFRKYKQFLAGSMAHLKKSAT
jgi:hypothetical protein